MVRYSNNMVLYQTIIAVVRNVVKYFISFLISLYYIELELYKTNLKN